MITDPLRTAPMIDWETNARRLVTLSLATLCPILRAHGITEATIDYDGYGDEGQVNDILLHDVDRKPVAMPAARCAAYHLTQLGALESEEASLEQALDRFTTEALETLHAGWENNEGALGTLVIDVEAAVATLEHSTRFISLESDTLQLGA